MIRVFCCFLFFIVLRTSSGPIRMMKKLVVVVSFVAVDQSLFNEEIFKFSERVNNTSEPEKFSVIILPAKDLKWLTRGFECQFGPNLHNL